MANGKKANHHARRRRQVVQATVSAPVSTSTRRVLKFFLAFWLLPICWVTVQCFFTVFGQATTEQAFWRTESFWFFSLGTVTWILAYALGGLRPTWWYVLGHELTHAVFVLLHGGRVSKIHVTRDGGHILTNKSNTMITLSPYFVPFWAVVVALVFWFSCRFVDLFAASKKLELFSYVIEVRWVWLLYGLLGVGWAFHMTYTFTMLRRDQPDLRENGWFFSVVLILLLNALLLSALLILASPSVTLVGFGKAWWGYAVNLWTWANRLLADLTV